MPLKTVILFHVNQIISGYLEFHVSGAQVDVVLTEVVSFLISLSILGEYTARFTWRVFSCLLSFGPKNANPKRQCSVIIVSIWEKDQSILRSLWCAPSNQRTLLSLLADSLSLTYWRMHATGNKSLLKQESKLRLTCHELNVALCGKINNPEWLKPLSDCLRICQCVMLEIKVSFINFRSINLQANSC